MQLDNPGVLSKQRVPGDNQSRPGDLYHPDFCSRPPAFFYVYVCNILFPSIISREFVCTAAAAAATAAAGDALKDKHHENNVAAFSTL